MNRRPSPTVVPSNQDKVTDSAPAIKQSEGMQVTLTATLINQVS